MRTIPSDFHASPELIQELLERPHVTRQADGTLKQGKQDGTGVVMLNGQWAGIPDWCRPLLDDALWEIERALIGGHVVHVMVNVVRPGLAVPMHRDPDPAEGRLSRWHLPLKTNPKAWFDDGRDKFNMKEGFWYGPVEYWNQHSVGNDGMETRIHLIVDLKGA